MDSRCVDHLDFTGEVCPDCNLPVDAYGNTEAQFENCCFPDCGCDGARLCMAGNASNRACSENVEGMWSARTPKGIAAVMKLVGSVHEDKKNGK